MCASQVLVPHQGKAETGSEPKPPPERRLVWDGASSLRLQPSDLSDPAAFYRRLEDWIRKQK